MSFQEIKGLNKVFTLLDSFNDFYEYLKTLSENKKLNLKKINDKITIIFSVEVLSKQQEIEIDLFPSRKDLNTNIAEIYQEILNIKGEIDFLKNQNEKLNNEVSTMKKENKDLLNKVKEQNEEIINLKEGIFYLNNKIMKKDEEKNIFPEIEKRMKKKIKKLKKIYQATIDGGDPINFHSKCDNVENTLVLIKSELQERFGGFTPIPWKSDKKGVYIPDPDNKTFIFSLDKNSIVSLRNSNYAVYQKIDVGPCFGNGWDIGIEGNPIKENKLWSFDSSISKLSYDNKGKALEYEVFKVIFH